MEVHGDPLPVLEQDEFAQTRAWRRAFSMATPAAAASATVSSSSTSVNTSADCLSVRYRFPNTSPRTMIGTPRNDLIGGWFGGKP